MNNSPQLVDIQFAVSQLGGNKALLAKMLGKFCNEFDKVPQQVITALEQDNLNEAKLKVHTTKGLSGNLGLTALYEASKVLDQQIRENQIDPNQLDAFELLMQKTIAHINELDLATVQEAPFTETTTSSNSAQTDIFIKRLQRNEFIDDDTLNAYINNLSLNEAQKNTLKDLVEELQYPKAIEMINQAR